MGIPYCEPTDEKQIKVLSFRNYLHAFDFISPAKNAIILKLVTTHQLTDTELNFNSIRVVLPRCRRSHRHLGCHPRSKGETDPTTTPQLFWVCFSPSLCLSTHRRWFHRLEVTVDPLNDVISPSSPSFLISKTQCTPFQLTQSCQISMHNIPFTMTVWPRKRKKNSTVKLWTSMTTTRYQICWFVIQNGSV